MPNAPHMMHNRRYILKPPICRCPNGNPPVRRCPPPPLIRRAGSLNITWRCASSWRRHWHGACSPAINTPAPARSCPRRLQAPRQLAGIRHASPSAALVWSLGGSGGRLAVARGDMSSRGGRASDATQRRALAPFQVLPAIARRLLCAHAPHGWASVPHGGRPSTGHGPIGCPKCCGAQKQARHFMPTGYSTTRRSGCSSPPRSQARHKIQAACGFYSAVGTIVPFVASTAGQRG